MIRESLDETIIANICLSSLSSTIPSSRFISLVKNIDSKESRSGHSMQAVHLNIQTKELK